MTGFFVKDIKSVDLDCKKLNIFKIGIIGSIVVCFKYGENKLLKGLDIFGLVQMMIWTALLVESFVALGADVRRALCKNFITQNCTSIPSIS